MRASSDTTIPSRSGLRRLISPWEYRHLQGFANARFAAGGFQLGVGLCLLGLASHAQTDQERRKMLWLSAWFLGPATLNFLGGFLDAAAARTAPPRT